MPSATVQGPQATALAAAAGRGASAAPRCGPHGGNVCVCGGGLTLGAGVSLVKVVLEPLIFVP